MSNRKKKVQIYVKPGSPAAKELTRFIGKHVDEINKRIIVKIIKVTPKNSRKVQNLRITKTPTLAYNGKKYIGTKKIIAILRPPTAYRDSYTGSMSAEEMVHRYLIKSIRDGEGEDEDENDPANRGDYLRAKAAAFQAKRPAMEGFNGSPPISGGRKTSRGRRRSKKTSFVDDEDFINAIGDVEETPTEQYFAEEDGDRILEDERNRLADMFGRKIGRHISKKR